MGAPVNSVNTSAALQASIQLVCTTPALSAQRQRYTVLMESWRGVTYAEVGDRVAVEAGDVSDSEAATGQCDHKGGERGE